MKADLGTKATISLMLITPSWPCDSPGYHFIRNFPSTHTPSLCNEEILYLVYASVFCWFRGLSVLFGAALYVWVVRWVKRRGNTFFPHLCGTCYVAKIYSHKKGAEVVGIVWSYIILGFGASKGNPMPRGKWGLTYGDWPLELSLVGRADFLEARAATRPTSPRCTASSSF